MAAQSVGVKAADLPDLTIKEAKIYVLDGSSWRNAGAGLSGGNEIASLVTASGCEGNFTLGNGAGGVRTPAGSWVDFAKANCVGKNLFDILPTISTIPLGSQPGGGGGGGRGGAAAAGGGAGGRRSATCRQRRRWQRRGRLYWRIQPRALEAGRMEPGPRVQCACRGLRLHPMGHPG